MLNAAEKGARIVSIPRTAVAVLATTVTLLAGCSAPSKKAVEPAPKPVPATAAPTPTTTETTPYDPFTYENNPQRLARVTTALQGFGLVVLKEAHASSSNWGPFDAYCSNTLEGGSNQGGWVSQGYKPVAGEDCEVQHSPQYGGENIQVIADVVVGADGAYTDKIQGAFINNVTCNVMVSYDNLDKKVPDVSVGKPNNLQSVDIASTLSQAEAIDEQAIACLDQTRP